MFDILFHSLKLLLHKHNISVFLFFLPVWFAGIWHFHHPKCGDDGRFLLSGCFRSKVLTVLVWQLPAWSVATELQKLLSESLWYGRYVPPLQQLDVSASRRDISLLSNKGSLSAVWMNSVSRLFGSLTESQAKKKWQFRWISVHMSSKYILLCSLFPLQADI